MILIFGYQQIIQFYRGSEVSLNRRVQQSSHRGYPIEITKFQSVDIMTNQTNMRALVIPCIKNRTHTHTFCKRVVSCLSKDATCRPLPPPITQNHAISFLCHRLISHANNVTLSLSLLNELD